MVISWNGCIFSYIAFTRLLVCLNCVNLLCRPIWAHCPYMVQCNSVYYEHSPNKSRHQVWIVLCEYFLNNSRKRQICNFWAIRGPKFGQRGTKVNQFSTLNQLMYTQGFNWITGTPFYIMVENHKTSHFLDTRRPHVANVAQKRTNSEHSRNNYRHQVWIALCEYFFRLQSETTNMSHFLATRGPKFGQRGPKANKFSTFTQLMYTPGFDWIGEKLISDNGRKPPLSAIVLATKGPKLDQRGSKANQFWTLTQ